MKSVWTALAGVFVALIAVGIFMAVDKAYLHWYAGDTVSSNADVVLLNAEAGALSSRISAVESDLKLNHAFDGGLARLAELWAVDQWSLQRHAAVNGNDPAVKACVDYIVLGMGSFVECGFARTGP
jgi:hypothetical protein